MRWLVTGGCGFIGSALVRQLHEEGEFVVVLDNLSVGRRDRVPAEVEVIQADVRVKSQLVMEVDIMVHLAAESGVPVSVANPRGTFLTNVLGTMNCLEAARDVGCRFVFASSGAVTDVSSPYGASKAAGEAYVQAYARTYGLRATSLRLSSIYGPGSDHKTSVIAKFVQWAVGGHPLEVRGDGLQTRDFVYVDDAARAIRHAANVEGTFAVATGIKTSVLDIAAMITRRTGVRHAIKYVDPLPGELGAGPDLGAVIDGWVPQVLLEDGVNRTIDYFARP